MFMHSICDIVNFVDKTYFTFSYVHKRCRFFYISINEDNKCELTIQAISALVFDEYFHILFLIQNSKFRNPFFLQLSKHDSSMDELTSGW